MPPCAQHVSRNNPQLISPCLTSKHVAIVNGQPDSVDRLVWAELHAGSRLEREVLRGKHRTVLWHVGALCVVPGQHIERGANRSCGVSKKSLHPKEQCPIHTVRQVLQLLAKGEVTGWAQFPDEEEAPLARIAETESKAEGREFCTGR